MMMFVEGKLTMSSCSSFVKPVNAVNENNYVLLEGSLAALRLFAFFRTLMFCFHPYLR